MGHGHQRNVYGVLDFLAMAQFRLNGTLSYPNIMHNKIHMTFLLWCLSKGRKPGTQPYKHITETSPYKSDPRFLT